MSAHVLLNLLNELRKTVQNSSPKSKLGPNKHGLVTYIQVMYILEIRCRGSTVAELSKLTYVED